MRFIALSQIACAQSADLEKQKTAAGNQSQLSKLSVIDIVEEYV